MKFELRPPRKQSSDSELLDDMKRVASLLRKSTLDQKEYQRHGNYAPGTLTDRFGDWLGALSEAGLGSARPLPATEDELITDLRRVSLELAKPSITMKEYERLGNYSKAPFARVFGTWPGALEKAGLSPSDNFHPRVSDEKLFRNLERVWIALGRQPAYLDMERPLSDHSVTTYERRFGSWRATLESFIAYVDAPVTESPEDAAVTPNIKVPRTSKPRKAERRTPRAPNDRLRFVVMRRDNFSCRSCGRSPAIEPGVVLHVDHVVPWADGGETTLQNLQTLCERCNLGKGTLGNEV